MTTALLAAEILLSKTIGDYHSSTTTSAGASDGTTLVDTELKAMTDDWVDTDAAKDMITSGTYDEEERRVTGLDSTIGALTMLAHGGQIASSVTYRIHRAFSASEKRRALIHSAKAGYPHIFKKIRDENKTVGNWLRNGCQEEWASSSYADYWRVSGVTATKNTTAPYYFRGSASCELEGSSGYYYQSNSEVSDLMDLAGKSITFSAKGYSDAADSLKLVIYDGTTTTSSDFHDGDSVKAKLSVTATIAGSPSEVSFRAYYTTGATVYVDDFRVIGPVRDKIYIGDLGFSQNKPHQILQSSDSGIYDEPWIILRDYTIGSDGYLYLPNATNGYRLRILGIGYLDFLKSGVSSTAWDATIDIDSPQTEILVAEAALYLYTQMIMPNYTRGDTERYERMIGFWKQELRDRQIRFGMKAPPLTIHWGN